MNTRVKSEGINFREPELSMSLSSNHFLTKLARKEDEMSEERNQVSIEERSTHLRATLHPGVIQNPGADYRPSFRRHPEASPPTTSALRRILMLLRYYPRSGTRGTRERSKNSERKQVAAVLLLLLVRNGPRRKSERPAATRPANRTVQCLPPRPRRAITAEAHTRERAIPIPHRCPLRVPFRATPVLPSPSRYRLLASSAPPIPAFRRRRSFLAN